MSSIAHTNTNYGFKPEIGPYDARIDELTAIIGKQQELLIQLNADVAELLKTTRPDTSRTNTEYLTEYLAVKSSREDITVSNYRGTLNDFIGFIGDKHVLTLNPGDVAAYFEHKKKTNSNNSMISVITQVKTFFNYLHDMGYVRVNAAAGYAKPKSEDTDRESLTHAQVKELFRAAVLPADHLLLTVLYGFGFRINEALRLTPGDIDFNANTLIIKKTKNHKRLCVPIPAKARDELQKYIADNGTQADKKILPFSDDTANRTQKRLSKMANLALPGDEQIKNLTNHIWRHTFVSHMAEKVNLNVVGKLVNHSGTDITQRYYHLMDNVSRKAMASHPINDL